MYHSVGDCRDDPYLVTVSPERLGRQLEWLRRRGLTGVGVGELMRAHAAGRASRMVGLTFDDGYADFLEYAVPLLLRYGHTATVFVLPGRLGGVNAWDEQGPRKPLLTADGIRAAAAAGMEVGSHGLLHLDLTAVDEDELTVELTESRDLLREITGHEPDGFCYPYGATDARTVAAARSAGYRYACSVDPGPLAGTFALPRAYVGQRDAAGRLNAKRLLHKLRTATAAGGPPAAPAPTPVPGDGISVLPDVRDGAQSGPRSGRGTAAPEEPR
ncbi:polysaccharide deacetylase family protein [Streptomyces sp. NPDC008139]|uniref:polysaccharide deacetylase family protein n=1 Tax=Streptomyces sp. NPDC008139 TaxID=3364814 RepID=UPI0036E12B10